MKKPRGHVVATLPRRRYDVFAKMVSAWPFCVLMVSASEFAPAFRCAPGLFFGRPCPVLLFRTQLRRFFFRQNFRGSVFFVEFFCRSFVVFLLFLCCFWLRSENSLEPSGYGPKCDFQIDSFRSKIGQEIL